MDLFGDLPPPAATSPSKPDALFGDLPRASSSCTTPPGALRPSSADGDEEPLAKRKPSAGCPALRGFVAHRRGERDEMQDAFRVDDSFLSSLAAVPHDVASMSYYGVFDGHAGAKAAVYCAEHLHTHVASFFPKGESENPDAAIRKSLVEAFRQTDKAFLQKATAVSPAWKDGCTAVTTLLVNDTLHVANLGDSKALLCRADSSCPGGVKVLPLSKDHSPSQYDERQRIQKAGGAIRDGRILGVLEVSRSIGDGRFKGLGVSNTPDVRRMQLIADDRFVLMACDGLFKAFGCKEAVERANALLDDESLDLKPPAAGEKPDPMRARCEAVCDRLCVEAVKRGCSDNVTVMLIRIEHQSA
eukprot:scpid66576/ scgid2040/ Integrin-linked kinase-associated serine/threonine phosphatase 2C